MLQTRLHRVLLVGLATLLSTAALTAQGGPEDNNILACASRDGVFFERVGVFVEGGGVPCLARARDGGLVAMFQWFPEGDPQAFNRIARRLSLDGGFHWGPPILVEIQDAPGPHAPPVDPSLVQLADGSWRLYFTSQLHGQPFAECFSARSFDGIHFDWEPGVRFRFPGASLLDPAVVLFQGRWHFYAPKPGAPGVALHATSPDGLDFRPEPDVVLPGMNFLGNALVLGHELRFYGTHDRGPGCAMAVSPDGFRWNLVAHTPPLPVADPAVALLPDGKFLSLVVNLARP